MRLQHFTSAADTTIRLQAERHPPLHVRFALHLFSFDRKSKDTESWKRCECVTWERWIKSDLIYT